MKVSKDLDLGLVNGEWSLSKPINLSNVSLRATFHHI